MTQRQPRLLDPGYLKWLRTLACSTCFAGPPCDAAHLRASSLVYDKPITGLARKPDDRWASPLCRSCHTRQHAHGDEVAWWAAHGINPFDHCRRLYVQYIATQAFYPRELHRKATRKIKPRKPRHMRAKIQSRGFAKKGKRRG